ncbi:hypothetical protein CKO09_01335 [Chromatium weissei]|nr:hypothetical protein [Chromatium weissei]
MQKSFVLSATRIVLLSTAAFTAFAWQSATAADSACKGLVQADCEGNAQCRWQPALTRKDGVQVNAHCRKATKKNAPADAAPAPATAPISAPAPALKTTTPAAATPVTSPAVPATEKKATP